MKFRHLISFTRICYLTVDYDRYYFVYLKYECTRTILRYMTYMYSCSSFVSFKIKFQNFV